MHKKPRNSSTIGAGQLCKCTIAYGVDFTFFEVAVVNVKKKNQEYRDMSLTW